MNNNEEPYVPPFIRRLMPNATEEEILQAAENLKGYLQAMYRIYCRQLEKPGAEARFKELTEQALRDHRDECDWCEEFWIERMGAWVVERGAPIFVKWPFRAAPEESDETRPPRIGFVYEE